MRAGSLVGLSDQQEIRIEEIANDAAQRDEFRTVTEAEFPAAGLARELFKYRNQPVPRRAGQDRACQHDGVVGILLAERAPDLAKCECGVLQRERAALIT